MLKKFFCTRLLALYISMAIIGFFIGYDYALITVRQDTGRFENVQDRFGKRHGPKANSSVQSDKIFSDFEQEDDKHENQTGF